MQSALAGISELTTGGRPERDIRYPMITATAKTGGKKQGVAAAYLVVTSMAVGDGAG